MRTKESSRVELKRYEVFIDQAVNTMAVIGFSGLVIIAFMTLLDVSFRYFGIARIPGLNDIEEVAFAIVVASCFPAGLKAGNAVTVKLLGSLLGRKAHKCLDIFGAILVLSFFCLVSWQFIIFTIDYTIAGRTTSTLEWSVAPVWIIVSFIMLCCIAVQSFMIWKIITSNLEIEKLTHKETSTTI